MRFYHFQDMFGEESVPRTLTGDKLEVIVDGKTATIDLSTLGVTCRYGGPLALFQKIEKKKYFIHVIFPFVNLFLAVKMTSSSKWLQLLC